MEDAQTLQLPKTAFFDPTQELRHETVMTFDPTLERIVTFDL